MLSLKQSFRPLRVKEALILALISSDSATPSIIKRLHTLRLILHDGLPNTPFSDSAAEERRKFRSTSREHCQFRDLLGEEPLS